MWLQDVAAEGKGHSLYPGYSATITEDRADSRDVFTRDTADWTGTAANEFTPTQIYGSGDVLRSGHHG